MIFRLEAVPEQTVRRYFLQVKKLTFKRAPGSQLPLCSTGGHHGVAAASGRQRIKFKY
jgi:hypothetical protein